MMKNTISEIKNSLEGINSRISEAEEWITDLEDKRVEIMIAEHNKEKRMKRLEDNLRDLWGNIKSTTFELQGSQKKKTEKKGLRKYLKRL